MRSQTGLLALREDAAAVRATAADLAALRRVAAAAGLDHLLRPAGTDIVLDMRGAESHDSASPATSDVQPRADSVRGGLRARP